MSTEEIRPETILARIASIFIVGLASIHAEWGDGG